jgi:EAL domain-containing protein (putative c-di-GMP-specific phosphodiesterase class I)
MNVRAMERLMLEIDLRRGLERKEFLLHYQPRVDLRTGEITGMEALVRWQHPEQGLVAPGRFIPVAEESGLIVPLGEWVLRTACAQNKAWQDAGLKPVCVAVNLSARQFRQRDLIEVVTGILRETGLDPSYLELELTESLIMQNVESTIVTLKKLNAMGIKLAIDDFGTGYSSLSYLKRFPIDMLKIDQSFVRDITTDPDDASIAKTIISMAHDMKLRVIAEGVETEEQRSFLSLRHCDEMQGYFFSRPVPAEAFEILLREHRCLQIGENLTTPGQRSLLLDD